MQERRRGEPLALWPRVRGRPCGGGVAAPPVHVGVGAERRRECLGSPHAQRAHHMTRDQLEVRPSVRVVRKADEMRQSGSGVIDQPW